MARNYTKLTRDVLEQTLEAGPPATEQPDEGYVLVNVLDEEQFEQEHIPGSINIPRGQIDAFEERFGKQKKIIVYCASRECPASNQAAEELADRGFQHVYDYEAGMRGWKEAGNRVEGSAA